MIKSGRKKIYALIVLALVGGAVAYFVSGNKPPGAAELIEVKMGTITQTVNVTGQIKPGREVNLSFERSGRATKVLVDTGDQVNVGTILAQLDQGETLASLKQAEAGLAAQRAKLEELRRGTRSEDIEVKRTELKKAEQDLANYYSSVPDTLNDAYTKADDSVRKQLSGFFFNAEEISPQLTFQVSDSQVKIDSESRRSAVSKELNVWKLKLASISSFSEQRELDTEIALAKDHLLAVRLLLNRLADALVASINLSDATLSTYQTALGTARTNTNSALAGVNTASQNIASQKIVVERIKNELNLKLAGNTPEQIAAQEAATLQATANLESAQVALSKTVLRSPIKGTVTKRNIEPGEIVSVIPGSAAGAIFSIISESQLEIEANVPEVDIGKVKIGDPVRITVDAFPGDNFPARITYIDPAETVVDGVINFRVKAALENKDARLKSGFTANLSIETLRKDNIPVLPQYAILEKDEGIFVRKYMGADQTATETKVTLGTRGADGMVEILEGISLGDRVENVGAKKR